MGFVKGGPISATFHFTPLRSLRNSYSSQADSVNGVVVIVCVTVNVRVIASCVRIYNCEQSVRWRRRGVSRDADDPQKVTTALLRRGPLVRMVATAAAEFRSARRPYDRVAREAAADAARARFIGRVQYDGSQYVGWQTQPSGRGVQDVLEARLSSLLAGRVYVAGSGRTDKGVHARDQVFHFELPAAPAADGDEPEAAAERKPHVQHVQLAAALEAADPAGVAAVLEHIFTGPRSDLPIDVQVTSVRVAPAGFHARDSCVGKRYVYTVEEGAGDPFTARYRWALGRGKRLDVARMAEAAALLAGTHDFSTFGVRDADDPRPPVKRMRRLEVRRVAVRDALSEAARRARSEGGGQQGAGGGGPPAVADASPAAGAGDGGDGDGDGGVVTICAECDRFLYNMMRMVSGTLVQVGLGKLSVEAVGELLAAKGRKGMHEVHGAQVFKAPAHGLCLERCFLEHEHAGPWLTSVDADGEDGADGCEV